MKLAVRCAVVAALFPGCACALERPRAEVTDVQPVLSQPVRVLAAIPQHLGLTPKRADNRERPVPERLRRRSALADPVVQRAAPQGALAATAGASFAGLGKNDFGYAVQIAPPDTTGAAGLTQYVQWVNTAFVVLDKQTGQALAGPVDGNLLFGALGASHPCATTNDGDPLVLFDRRAQRWVLSQFAVEAPYYQCVAVSQTADATGAYWLYAYAQPRFNDYGKLGIWGDAYYIAYNLFRGDTYLGVRACAMRRATMIKGGAGKQVCFTTSADHYSLLPADLDGASVPPAGAPEYFVELDGTRDAALAVFRFHADFATPANSTFTGPTGVAVAPYALPCGGDGGVCVAQPATTQQLDTLGDRLMYRLAYRRRGTVQSLFVNHSVAVSDPSGEHVGVRWYELRPDGADGLKLFQQSTWAPDSGNRWVGSVATDKLGNLALGYSVADASRTIFPSIRYTGRLRGDPRGTLQAEATIVDGTGSQRVSLERWGDYSTMVVDPVDDCTFWYTNQYLQNSGTYNWHTRIASFRFPGCS